MESAGKTIAVVPVKELINVKRRLSSVLGKVERQALFSAMVTDVLDCIRGCQAIAECWVITDDPQVSELARGCGALVYPEPEQRGLIAAVSWAAREMASIGAARLVFLPGDVPLVTVQELETILLQTEAHPEGAAEFVIAPARDLGGSNCVCCSPPDCMEFGFGIDSYRKHLKIAKSRGVTSRVQKLYGVGLDIDTREDLLELIKRLKGSKMMSNTQRYLEESGLIRKLDAAANSRDQL